LFSIPRPAQQVPWRTEFVGANDTQPLRMHEFKCPSSHQAVQSLFRMVTRCRRRRIANLWSTESDHCINGNVPHRRWVKSDHDADDGGPARIQTNRPRIPLGHGFANFLGAHTGSAVFTASEDHFRNNLRTDRADVTIMNSSLFR
jgi:hypothetical protein